MHGKLVATPASGIQAAQIVTSRQLPEPAEGLTAASCEEANTPKLQKTEPPTPKLKTCIDFKVLQRQDEGRRKNSKPESL